MDIDLHDTMQVLKKYNQEHLLAFFDELTMSEKETLLSQIHNIDFEKINNLYINSTMDDSISYDRISPIPFVDKSKLSTTEVESFSQIGNEVINKGKLAIITLAGGQGTRLGYKGPKGSYEIDVPPKKSLFEFACDNLKELHQLTGTYLNWYIMTSPANDLATKDYFEHKNFFGYPKDKIKFFIQSTLPTINVDTKVILETPYSVKSGSNGNGDVFKAFSSAGYISELENNDIEWVFIGGIDNILLKLVDPLFLGLTISGNYQIASKSIRKLDLNSPDWVFANVDGCPHIIDPKNLQSNNLENYNQKNILAHLFSISALKKLANVNLPYHRAFKKCDFINAEGMKEVPTKPNSFKFEKFIFDAFSVFDRILLLEVNPSEEFAPIKAFTGNETPETALDLYKKYHHME
ncbi:MAG: UTP--glucose-1-phosphate uridylyltransferase [Clostridia bacterium]